MKRILSKKSGANTDILFIILSAVHGNEPVGVLACEKLFAALENISVNGTIVGIIGNKKAYSKKVRFIEQDLNRLFVLEKIKLLREKNNLENDEAELIELLDCIENEINSTQPKKIFLIDVHSTSADSPLFSIVNDDTLTWEIAEAMHVPVVTGLVGKLSGGSTLDYFSNQNFSMPICSISIEAGQHDDTSSVLRAINYLVKMLEYVGIVEKNKINIFNENSTHEHLPILVKFSYRHAFTPDDHFVMNPGYKSFQKISKGEVLAQDKNGAVLSPKDGFILMPLYQKQGSDGFFLVEEI